MVVSPTNGVTTATRVVAAAASSFPPRPSSVADDDDDASIPSSFPTSIVASANGVSSAPSFFVLVSRDINSRNGLRRSAWKAKARR